MAALLFVLVCTLPAKLPSFLSNRMSDSQNGPDFNIYDDVDSVTDAKPANLSDYLIFELQLKENEKKIEKLQVENTELKKKYEESEAQNLKNSKVIQVLKTNLSSLYKTAKLELERREQEIADLRSQHDSLLFRRTNSISQASPPFKPLTTQNHEQAVQRPASQHHLKRKSSPERLDSTKRYHSSHSNSNSHGYR